MDDLTRDGLPITVSAVARLANVHRSLIYRHDDLHAAVRARSTQPEEGPAGPQVSRRSLLADLTERAARQAQHIVRLEQRLSQALGQDAWRAAGLGSPTDVNALQQKIANLEQGIADLTAQLGKRDDDLAASRATNRDLMTQLNTFHTRPR